MRSVFRLILTTSKRFSLGPRCFVLLRGYFGNIAGLATLELFVTDFVKRFITRIVVKLVTVNRFTHKGKHAKGLRIRFTGKDTMKLNTLIQQAGATGYILLWLLGIPIPILLLIFLLRGCT